MKENLEILKEAAECFQKYEIIEVMNEDLIIADMDVQFLNFKRNQIIVYQFTINSDYHI